MVGHAEPGQSSTEEELDEAEQLLKTSVGLQPDKSNLCNLGAVQLQKGDFASAESSLRAGVRDGDAECLSMLAIAVDQQGKHRSREAEALFKQSVLFNPSHEGALINYAGFLSRHNKFTLAIETYKKAIAVNPANEIAKRQLASLMRGDTGHPPPGAGAKGAKAMFVVHDSKQKR